MPDAEIVADNAAQLARLEALVGRMSDADLQRDLGGGWRVYVALAHLAFWDRRATYVLGHWPMPEVQFSDEQDAIMNAAVEAEIQALDPRVAAQLALTAARSVGDAVAALSDDTAASLRRDGFEWLMRRANHRREHIEQIEAALQHG